MDDINLGTEEQDSVYKVHRDMSNDLESCMQELKELQKLYTETSEELLNIKQEIDEKSVELRLKKSEVKKYKDKLALLESHITDVDNEIETAKEELYRHSNNDIPKFDNYATEYSSDAAEVFQYFDDNGDALPFISLIDKFGASRIHDMLQQGLLIKRGRDVLRKER